MEMTREERQAMALAAAMKRLEGKTPQEVAALTYEQPQPPPGVTINTAKGPMYSKGGGELVPTTEAEMSARAAREVNGRLGDQADTLAGGLPFVGPFLGRARAGLQAAFGKGDYASNLEQEQAAAKTYAEDYPVESTTMKVAGAVGGSLGPALLASGAAKTLPIVGSYIAPAFNNAAGRVLFGVGASSLPGAMVRGGVAGGLQGGAQGAGDTKDLTNVPQAALDTAKGAGLGAAIGSAIPAVIGGASKVVDAVRNRGSDIFSSVPQKTVDWLTTQLSPARIASLRQDMQQLGPEAMPADVSPLWRGIARDAAARPETIDEVVGALTTRDAAKNARIRAPMNDLGPVKSPLTVETELGDAFKKLSPEYEALWPNAKAVDTSALAQKLETMAIDKRGVGQEVARDIRKMLNVSGTDQLDPNPRTLHEIRQEIDKMGRSEKGRMASTDLKEIRQLIDAELADKVPGIKAVDSKWADLSRQGEAYDTGKNVFSRDTWPDQVAKMRGDVVQPAGSAQGPATRDGLDRLTQGARAKMEQIVGNDSNDVAALNRLLKGDGDWGREKLATVFGKDKAERLLNVLDAEQVFQNTKNRVVAGSDIAQTQGFREHLDEAFQPKPGILEGVEITNFPFKIPSNIVKGMRIDRATQTAEEAARNLGRFSVAQGQQGDAVLQALLARAQRSNALAGRYGQAGAAGAITADPVTQALLDRTNGGRR